MAKEGYTLQQLKQMKESEFSALKGDFKFANKQEFQLFKNEYGSISGTHAENVSVMFDYNDFAQGNSQEINSVPNEGKAPVVPEPPKNSPTDKDHEAPGFVQQSAEAYANAVTGALGSAKGLIGGAASKFNDLAAKESAAAGQEVTKPSTAETPEFVQKAAGLYTGVLDSAKGFVGDSARAFNNLANSEKSQQESAIAADTKNTQEPTQTPTNPVPDRIVTNYGSGTTTRVATMGNGFVSPQQPEQQAPTVPGDYQQPAYNPSNAPRNVTYSGGGGYKTASNELGQDSGGSLAKLDGDKEAQQGTDFRAVGKELANQIKSGASIDDMKETGKALTASIEESQKEPGGLSGSASSVGQYQSQDGPGKMA